VGYAKKNNFCPVFFPVVAKIPQNPFLNSEVAEPIFIAFSQDVETFMTRLIHAFAKQYCILFRNDRAKSEGGEF